MSDSGGIGSFANDPFAISLQRQQGNSQHEEQQKVQEQAILRGEEAPRLSNKVHRSLRERERNEILELAGPGLRQEKVQREGDSPRFRQLSDETAEIDTLHIQRERRGPTLEDDERAAAEDQVNLSEEAQRRLSQETSPPPRPGEVLEAEPNDPLRIDTPRERQDEQLSDQVDRGLNETQLGRQLGRVLDQFS